MWCRVFLFALAVVVATGGRVHSFMHSMNDEVNERHRCNYILGKRVRPCRSGPTSGDANQPPSPPTNDGYGFLILLTVPVAWASYEPVVRYVYTLDFPIPGLVFSFSYYLIATLALVPAALKFTEGSTLGQKTRWPAKEGIELGTYLFIGNVLQLLGLQTVASDRAAFLLQVKSIFVPLLEAFVAQSLASVSSNTWFSCPLALLGVSLMGFDDNHKESSLALEFGAGDIYILAAAAIYSLHIIRLGEHAKKVSALKLASTKATTECSWSFLIIAALTSYAHKNANTEGGNDTVIFANEQGTAMNSFFSTLWDGSASLENHNLFLIICATMWTGLVTIAYTIYAQAVGQKTVSATTANLIYMVQPICTACFSWALLGERLDSQGYFGAALIMVAVLLAAEPEEV